MRVWWFAGIFILFSSALLILDEQAYRPLIYIVDPANRNLFDGPRIDPLWALVQATLERAGYAVKQIDSVHGITHFDYLIFHDMPREIAYIRARPQIFEKNKLILVLWEPPSVKPANWHTDDHEVFGTVLTWYDAWLDNKQYIKFYYPQRLDIVDDIFPFERKKLCTLIANNKASKHASELYSERLKAIEFYEKKHRADFDFYGQTGWSRQQHPCYQGTVGDKREVLKKYKFCICYENIYGLEGYVTEKIFDCLRGGCVPVYWGAQNIRDYIPETCFIDRTQFADDEQLYVYLQAMDAATYENYLTAAREFLARDTRARLFSLGNFVKTYCAAVLGCEVLQQVV